MPRFFINIFDGKAIFDDEGYELPDRAAVKGLVQRVLFDAISCEKIDHAATRVRADVRDEKGALIMTAQLLMSIDEFGEHI